MDFERRNRLKQRETELRAAVSDLEGQLAARSERLGELAASEKPDEAAMDKLQVETEVLRRKRERLELQISALAEQLGRAEEQDARELAAVVGADLRKASKDRDAAVRAYIAAVEKVSEAIGAVAARSCALATLHAQAAALRKGFGIAVEAPAGTDFDEQLPKKLVDQVRELAIYPDASDARTVALHSVLEERRAEGRSFVPPPPSKPKANFWRDVFVDRPNDAVTAAAKAAVEAGDSHGWEMIGEKARAIFLNEAAAERFASLFQRDPGNGNAVNAPHAVIGEPYAVGE